MFGLSSPLEEEWVSKSLQRVPKSTTSLALWRLRVSYGMSRWGFYKKYESPLEKLGKGEASKDATVKTH